LKKNIESLDNTVFSPFNIQIFFDYYFQIKKFEKLNQLEKDFSDKKNQFEEKVSTILKQKEKEYFNTQINNFMMRLDKAYINKTSIYDLYSLVSHQINNKYKELFNELYNYKTMENRIYNIVKKIEDPSTRLTEIKRINFLLRARVKYDLLNHESVNSMKLDIDLFEKGLSTSVQKENSILQHILDHIEKLINKLNKIKKENPDFFIGNRLAEIDKINHKLLELRSHAYESDYVEDELILIDNNIVKLNSKIKSLQIRRSLIEHYISSLFRYLNNLKKDADDKSENNKIIEDLYNKRVLLTEKSINSANSLLINLKDKIFMDRT
jgi:hypothetical protein|tara:strand:- start:135 stop:1106 length:972 start_codon:yes stop_codon:yes gene_type:complete